MLTILKFDLTNRSMQYVRHSEPYVRGTTFSHRWNCSNRTSFGIIWMIWKYWWNQSLLDREKVIGFEVCCLQCFVWQLQYLCDYNIWFNLIFNERIEILRWQKGLRHVRRRDDRILIPRKRMIFGDMEEDRGRDDASLSQPLSDQPRAREIGTLYREAWRENWFYLERKKCC